MLRPLLVFHTTAIVRRPQLLYIFIFLTNWIDDIFQHWIVYSNCKCLKNLIILNLFPFIIRGYDWDLLGTRSHKKRLVPLYANDYFLYWKFKVWHKVKVGQGGKPVFISLFLTYLDRLIDPSVQIIFHSPSQHIYFNKFQHNHQNISFDQWNP